MNRAGLLRNAVYLAPAVRIFGRPVHLSTVGAAVGEARQGDGARLAPCVGRHSIVRPWGCRCVGGGVCYETVQEKNRGELGAAALRTGASLAFPVLDALAEGAEVLSGRGCRGGGFGRGARGCASADAAGRGALDERCAGRLRIAVRPEPQTADARIGRIFFGMRVSRRIGGD